MNCYLISAKMLAPLLVQQHRQTHTPKTLEYLPGSSLRGALAGAYLRIGGNPKGSIFMDLFGLNGPLYPDLLPASKPEILSECLPLTAISCKRYPGFKLQNNAHGVRDSLTMLAYNRWSDQENSKFWQCPDCNNDCTLFNGFWNNQLQNPIKEQPSLILKRHTGIDRCTGTVAASIFYSPQIMREDISIGQTQYLTGRIFLSNSQKEALQELISNQTIFAGADRARGFGELQIELQEMKRPKIDLSSWSKAWKQKYVEDTGEEPWPGEYFSLKLASNSILVDDFLRPTANLDLDFTGLECVGKSVKQTLVRGWQASWGLPKPDDPAIQRGSVYLFRYTKDELKSLEQYLNELSQKGVGLRKTEGLGAVRICEPIHVQEEL